MAHRHLTACILLLLIACGGRESTVDNSTTSTGTGGDGNVTTGTAGSNGATSGGTGGFQSGGTGGFQSGGSPIGGQSGGFDITGCTSKDVCVLEPVNACGPGCEPVAITQFAAINQQNESIWRQLHRAVPCAAIACAPVSPQVANLPNYYATCESGHCEPTDVRTTSLSACTDSTDCYLRNGTSCCGCGGGSLIAVSRKANVEQVFCASGVCAADCVPAPVPPGVNAACYMGHCRVFNPTIDAATF